MSNSILGSFKTIIMSIVVGLLLVSLAIWGVSDAFTPQTKDAAAMVGKEKITLLEFDKYFKRRLSDENKEQPQRLTTKQAYARGFHQVVLNQLITEKLIQLDADDLGIDVNRRDARDFVEGMDVFNNEITGKLDEGKLLQRLAQSNSRTSKKQFEQDVFQALRQQQTLSAIAAGIIAPGDFAEQQFKFMTEQRKVKYLRLTSNAVSTPADPGDEALQTYIDKNPAGFTAPEYRRFTVLRMEVDDIVPDMEASDEEIKDQFEYKIDVGLLGTQETRSITQIVAGNEATANLVTAALNDGKSANEITKQYELEAPIVYEDVLAGATSDPKTGELAFTLQQGKAQSLQGSFATWYSVIVTNVTPKLIPNIAAETESISLEIRTEKAKKTIYDMQKEIQRGLDEGMTLEEVGKANAIGVASYDFVSRLGETEASQKMIGKDDAPGVSEDDLILVELFTSDVGFEGDIFETTKKGVAAIRVDGIKDSKQREFTSIRDQALKAWRLEATYEALGELQDTLAAKVNNGETLDAIATSIDNGAKVEEVSMLRAAPLPGLSGQLLVRLFEARKGQTIRGTGDNGLDRIIGKITEITPNTDILIGDVESSLTEKAAEAINNDIQQAYHAAILKTFPTKTLDTNISKILGIDQ